MERTILHSDLNNFYASVECIKNPKLKNKYVAVCGSEEDRHGIVLAKNQLAKNMGVKTGDVIWEARQKCPELIVLPPDFNEYMKYSKIVKELYYNYTDLIEPFGLDEAWLDVSGSLKLFGKGSEIAYKVKENVKKETGLTVSVGVSFNKIFAKLGSDMKKPDAVTCIEKETFKEQVWKLPVSELLGVGRSTAKKLTQNCIRTIGDLANYPPQCLKSMFGINGITLWKYANGLDNSPVTPYGYTPPVKSVGHGITCREDLVSEKDVWCVILELTQDIARKLRLNGLVAEGVGIGIKDNTLHTCGFQKKLDYTTANSMDIAKEAFSLFVQNYGWENNVRAVSVRAINLMSDKEPRQIPLFEDSNNYEKIEKVETAIEKIRHKYGNTAVTYACLIDDIKMPDSYPKIIENPFTHMA